MAWRLDLGNKYGAIVVGTGDLTEAALGWCTFGGDALAGYNVNVTVPKTAIRRMEQAGAVVTSYEAILFELMETSMHPKFKEISALIK